MTEPAEPVHICFEATEEDAIRRLIDEMDAAYGKRIWVRQPTIPRTSRIMSEARNWIRLAIFQINLEP